MYNEQENRNINYIPEAEPSVSRIRMKRNQKKGTFLRKAAAIVLSAAIFGGVASGSFFGVNMLLGNLEIGMAENAESIQENSISLSAMSYMAEASDYSLNVTEVAAQGLPSVVSVTNISVQEVQDFFSQFGRNGRGQTQLQETTSCGSGVIMYSNDAALYIVTNYHVVEGATTLSVTFVDDQTYEAEICGYDETMDIALLKVSMEELSSDTLSQISVVSVGESDELMVGEQVVAIGNALGYGQSVTTGIVSALDRAVSTDTGSSTYIQTDAAINPGNSGGALFNLNGELIGINTAKVSSTDVEGMGYAIPISQVLELISSLMNT
jgi:serine protease Do